MPTTSHDPSSKPVKQNRAPGVQTGEPSRDEAKSAKQSQSKEAQRETAAKPDKERSDWEGMSPKPEQGEDDVAAPGQLPETD
jgi:hypothetical protein